MGQVLWGNDADDTVAIEDGNQLGALSCHDAAKGFDEGVVGLGDLEGTCHHTLDIAVALGLQRFDDALAGDGSNKIIAAYDGEDILQGVDGALQSFFEGVGGGEGAEVGQHDVAHADGIVLGGKEEVGVVHVRADEDEAADHDEPHIGQDASGDGEKDADDLAEARGGACSFEHAVIAGEFAAEDTATVEGSGGEKIDGGEEKVGPDEGAEKMRRGKPGALEEVDLRSDGENDCPEEEAEEEIGDRADEAEAFAYLRGRGALGGLVGGVLLQAAGGQKEDAAEVEAIPGRGDGAGDLANDHSEEEKGPEQEAARACRSGDRCVADGEAEQQKEEGVDTYLHAEKSADRERPSAHAYHCMRWGCGKERDARHCGKISVEAIVGAEGDEDETDQRPSAGDAVQCNCGSH